MEFFQKNLLLSLKISGPIIDKSPENTQNALSIVNISYDIVFLEIC